MNFSKNFTLFCCLFAPALGFADISDFNRAIQAGDYQSAAGETAGIWAGYNRESPQTATVAREFGFVNYLARDYDNALIFARFLAEEGDELTVPDDQPATSALLLRLTEYAVQPVERQRSALAEALSERLQAPGVDSISLRAAETLYRNDWAARRWAMASISAAQAAELYLRAGDGLRKEAREAALYSAQADFAEAAEHADYYRMVTLHDDIVQDIQDSGDAAVQTALLKMKWQAEAWVRAMEIYFHSSSSQLGTIIRERLRFRDLRPLETATAGGSACGGTVETGSLMYPRELANQQLAGAVIVRLSFDAEGRVTESEIVAEAPAGLFATAVNEALPTFSLQPAPGTSCQSGTEMFHTLGFWGNCAASYTRGDCPAASLRTNVLLKDAANL